jgi:sugar/nucleoside kinase (ribokinase family)
MMTAASLTADLTVTEPRLGVLGDNTEDIVVHQSTELAIGSDTNSKVLHIQGGSAANTAVAAAELIGTRFIGCVGQDHSGQALVTALESAGVEVCVQRSETETGTVVVLIAPGGDRTMLPDRGANSFLETVPEAWLDGLECLHLNSYSLQANPTLNTVIETVKRLRERGAVISIDTSSASLIEHYGTEVFLKLLAEIDPDVVFANELEAEVLGWDVNAPAKQMLVLKHGGEPVLVRTSAGSVRVPLSEVSGIVDFTGAGDAFAAGFLAAILNETRRLSPTELRGTAPESAELVNWCLSGHAAATKVITKAGAGVQL